MLTMSESPDLIVHNALVYTVNPAQPAAQAVAMRKHRILAVGFDDEVLALAGPQTQLIDAGGHLVLPGLCDAHIHFGEWCLMQNEVQLADTQHKADMLQRIADRAMTTPPGAWLVGRGWNESRWGETSFPTAADLDRVTGPDRPALFYRSDMHCAVVNSAALRLAGISAATPNPAGGVIERNEQGQPTGVLKELASALVSDLIPPASPEEFDALLRTGIDLLHRLGITAIHDQRIKDQDDGPRSLASFQRLRRAGALTLRVACNVAAHQLDHVAALGLQTNFGDDYLRLSHVKVFSDGSLGSRTAWMLEPFVKAQADEPDNRGVVVTPPEQMAREFRAAVELGFPISVHAIGDRANRVVLDIFEELADSGLQPSVPHRMEHVQIMHRDDLARLAQLGITASVQPIHATDDMDTADLLLGARAANIYNFRSLLDAGTRLAFGSDAPVADANPFLGIHAAVCRQRVERMAQGPWQEGERIDLAATIRAYTLGAAEAAGWERTIGSIAPGKRADLIVLDRDLFECVDLGVKGDELAAAQVLLTIFDGAVVWENLR